MRNHAHKIDKDKETETNNIEELNHLNLDGLIKIMLDKLTIIVLES